MQIQKSIYYIVAVFAALGIYYMAQTPPKHVVKIPPIIVDYKGASYDIDGKIVRLSGGISEQAAAPGSASKITTKYFGNEVWTDLDGDGRKDVIFIITEDSGGSGTFYYLVGALQKDGGYFGTKAFYLGDRIAPQTTEQGINNQIVVNFADHKKGQSMTSEPSVGKSVYLVFNKIAFGFDQINSTLN